jgi:hypothetical protein
MMTREDQLKQRVDGHWSLFCADMLKDLSNPEEMIVGLKEACRILDRSYIEKAEKIISEINRSFPANGKTE